MKKREFYFDNAKFLLIFLVVVGHFITSFIANKAFAEFYILIYLFHMPAFILLSGYFAKGIHRDGYIKKIAKKLLIPYLLFQIIYSFYYFFLYDKDELTIQIFQPHWSLWFLLSMFCWNVLLLLFAKIIKSAKWSMLIAVLVGLTVGYIDQIGNYLSLSRTFVLFPVFLLGYYMKNEHFQKLVSKRGKWISSIAIVAIIVCIHFVLIDMQKEWMYGSKSYETLDAGWEGGIIRFLYYGLSLIMMLSFFTFVPKRELFFTKWGARTLYVYLLHGFIIMYFRDSGLVTYIKETNAHYLLLIFSIVVTLVLSSQPVYVLAQPILELRMDGLRQLFKRQKQMGR